MVKKLFALGHHGEHYVVVAYSTCEAFDLGAMVHIACVACAVLGILAIMYDRFFG